MVASKSEKKLSHIRNLGSFVPSIIPFLNETGDEFPTKLYLPVLINCAL